MKFNGILLIYPFIEEIIVDNFLFVGCMFNSLLRYAQMYNTVGTKFYKNSSSRVSPDVLFRGHSSFRPRYVMCRKRVRFDFYSRCEALNKSMLTIIYGQNKIHFDSEEAGDPKNMNVL